MNPNTSLDSIVAQKIGEMTIQNAKLTVMNQTLAMELKAARETIAELRAREPELPLVNDKEKANGATAH